MDSSDRDSSEQQFINYWETKAKRSKTINIVISVFYGFMLSFLINYFRLGSYQEVFINWDKLLVYAVPLGVFWWLKGHWQHRKMEKRYRGILERRKQMADQSQD
jgi:hypothetical protein